MGTEIALAQQGVFSCQNFQAGSRRTSPEVGMVTVACWKARYPLINSYIVLWTIYGQLLTFIFSYFPPADNFQRLNSTMSKSTCRDIHYPERTPAPRRSKVLLCPCPILLELLCRANLHLFALVLFALLFFASFVAMISPREYFALDTSLHITHVFNESAQLMGREGRET